ncbi:MAG: hypothetical protein K5930_01320 [Treponemataceae bacterium]|nr:hypothetical protein [Treponemataceae bacterium]
MLKTKMILHMQGYWAVGSGKGGGNEVDNRIDRDADGLPYVPGKMLKGLIKDACLRLKNAGNSNYNFVDEVFGNSGSSDGLNRTATSEGKIYISDARLSPAMRSALKKEENAAAKAKLTRNIYSTAIDNETGTAKDKSLRGYEVAIPMELQAEVECDCTEEEMDCIKVAASKLVYAVGSHKSRGLGEVIIEFKDEA